MRDFLLNYLFGNGTVGADDGVHTQSRQLFEKSVQGVRRLFKPALDGDVAVLDVRADCDPRAKASDGRGEKFIVCDSRRAEDDTS